MKKNMGSLDKGIRIVIAIVIALLYYFNVIEGTLAYVLMALAIVFLLTSFISFCPLYLPFGWNTCKRK
ncbi:YgaP family membrane protein [Winogradskyella poriferorum]|uniref:YgaP family membrane protein n=1 Tax=Winogradskyella poriferorum TaxID=307627 RepID=UPI003D6520C6